MTAFVFDLGEAIIDGVRVELSNYELILLRKLIQMEGSVMSKRMAMNALYRGDELVPSVKIIDVMICHLKRKLKRRNRDHIHTAWGRGHYWRKEGPWKFPTQRFLVDMKRKAIDGFYTLEELTDYHISAAELAEWKADLRLDPIDGLLVTRQNKYEV